MTARALDDVTSSLGYGVYDADTHYYEPYDAFTRHIDPEFRDRAVHSRPDAKELDCEEWPDGVRDFRRDLAAGNAAFARHLRPFLWEPRREGRDGIASPEPAAPASLQGGDSRAPGSSADRRALRSANTQRSVGGDPFHENTHLLRSGNEE
jgi:hypothetical protein